jgi:6-phosphogluconolactonase (cycloisomerase 2 family)
MRFRFRRPLAMLVLCGIALVATPVAAVAATPQARAQHQASSEHDLYGPSGAVFVQTDSTAGNRIVAFERRAGGTLAQVGSYSTGGNGGVESGAVVDSLASQDSLVYDNGDLYAVNAGSNTISVFAVFGTRLFLVEVLPSGGSFPTSIAASGHGVYVLNAGGAGTVAGFFRLGPFLVPIPGDRTSLGLDNTTPPNYLMAPGDIGFTPDGRQLIVTTKASGSDIDVFGIGLFGYLSKPVANPSTTPVPFAFTFGPDGSLVVAEAADSAVSTYRVNPDGTLTALASLADGQAALCWITPASGFDYVANAGSNDLSAYEVGNGGTLSLVGSGGVVAGTGTGPIDMAASPGGRYLYAQAGGAGTVDEFAVNSDGSLAPIGSVTGLGAGFEGIAAD